MNKTIASGISALALVAFAFAGSSVIAATTEPATLPDTSKGNAWVDATSQGNILHVMSSIADVGSAISKIGQIDNVSDVRLVRLDDLDMGETEQAFIGALALQRATAEVHALRAAVAGNPQLIAELRKQNINFRSIVAIDIGRFGTITVYTFGASS